MSKAKRHITVFEHQAIRIGIGENRLSEDQYEALQRYYGKGVPYFQLIHNGVKFNQHVGVIQVGDTTIEVLPKADKLEQGKVAEENWRKVLIGMLKAVGSFDIKTTGNSHLRIKTNTILDLYFEQFIKEVEYLLHQGLVKKYRTVEGNRNALKGRLQFNKNIQHNCLHQERFYVRYTTYDVAHVLHQILYKTIRLLKQINTNVSLQSRIGNLFLNFPEMPKLKVTAATFEKLVFNRKTQVYKKAIAIARLLLLQYHPDISKGRNDVLALMFDMNILWEKFVLASLKKHRLPETKITAQASKYFWQSESGYRSQTKADILIQTAGINIVLDTKWKNGHGKQPAINDLRQLYVYQEYHDAKKVALVYPGKENDKALGWFVDRQSNRATAKECSILFLAVDRDIKQWQWSICEELFQWMK